MNRFICTISTLVLLASATNVANAQAFQFALIGDMPALYSSMVVGTKPPEKLQPSPFDDYINALAEEMESYDKPVAFLHGDTHRFRIDHSLYSTKTNRRFENFIRVETYGSPDIHWVRATVDPADPQLFRFDPQIVPDNVANHRK